MTSTVITTDTALMRMTHHLTRHLYKKGAFQGDAPLETTTAGRAKSHIRVMKVSNYSGAPNDMVVRMWNTDILTAREDGTVVINLGGHQASPTTRKAINLALSKFVNWHYGVNPLKGRCRIHTGGLSSNRVPVYYANGASYVYYNGMVIDGNTGEMVSEKHPFVKIAVDRNQTKEFMQGIEESGFKALFPMLWSNCEGPNEYQLLRHISLTQTLIDSQYAKYWQDAVARNSFRTLWTGIRTYEKNPKEVVWAALMKHCKSPMYKKVVTDIYEIR